MHYTRTIIALVLVILTLPVSAHAANVVILKSKNTQAYNDAVVAFRTNCGATYEEYDMAGDMGRGKAFVGKINEAKPDLVYAVGIQAAKLAKETVDPSIPVLFAMVLNPERFGLKADNVTGISLEIPVEVQLSALRSIVPKARKVGLIYNPKKMGDLVEQARAVAGKLGIEIVASKVDAPEDTPRALRAFSAGIDAFWLIPDPTVVTPQAFKAILEFSQKSNVPFFAYNDAFVKAGALLSLGPNSTSIGAQACEMAREILTGKSPSAIAVANPKGLELYLNMKTSAQLGLSTVANNAVVYSAREGYKINVTQ